MRHWAGKCSSHSVAPVLGVVTRKGGNVPMPQVPHHFVDSCFGDGCVCGSNRVIPTHPHDCVTFYALSGATQTGPNVFWILSSLQYAALSGDYDWLRSAMPDLR